MTPEQPHQPTPPRREAMMQWMMFPTCWKLDEEVIGTGRDILRRYDNVKTYLLAGMQTTYKIFRSHGVAVNRHSKYTEDNGNLAVRLLHFDSKILGLDENFIFNVQAPAEAAIDSRAVRFYSETALKKLKLLKTNVNAFNNEEFFQRFRQLMSAKAPINNVGSSKPLSVQHVIPHPG
ncbi:hypothetical protein PCANC_08403 [Puccinia coronata f. sp. avenae]|uniref:Nse4/EID protein Nse3/MAGE-binding domain-containing protein n=1 Tax=Puccinia coronata f. sp. avenae TaxID=200324 RepID=A0A2N5VPV4_9BASI|nr:hypothetical protein PCANC_08403 [Puccinia coronata f. sp. avenae]